MPRLRVTWLKAWTNREFDVCAIQRIAPAQFEGHAYSYIHRTYLSGRVLAVVPILLTLYEPPNPVTPRRCVQLGRELKSLIRILSR